MNFPAAHDVGGGRGQARFSLRPEFRGHGRASVGDLRQRRNRQAAEHWLAALQQRTTTPERSLPRQWPFSFGGRATATGGRRLADGVWCGQDSTMRSHLGPKRTKPARHRDSQGRT